MEASELRISDDFFFPLFSILFVTRKGHEHLCVVGSGTYVQWGYNALPGGTVTNTERYHVSDTTDTAGITQHEQTFALRLFALVRPPVRETAGR